MSGAIASICAAIERDDAGMRLGDDEMREVIAALDAAEADAGQQRTRADAAEAECARLREAMRRQSAAVRLASTARATIDAHDQATLRSLRGQDRAALIEELAAARREGDDWNARATALESERDEARAETDALRAQLAEARAIVEGRTVAPADAERAAHSGEWLVRYRDSRAVRWWPLDSTGRPCAWPTGGGL